MRMYAAAKPKVAVDWGGLVQEVRSIPNTADRALVSCWTTELLHDLDRKGALDLLLAAEGDLTLIPDEIDRLTRLESIASAYKSLGERREASRAITAAFNATQLMGDDQRVWELQDRIIEKANAISPELASSLTPLIDDEVRRYSLEEKTYSRQLELRPADIAKQADEGFWVIQTNARAAFHLRRSLAGGRTGTQSADVASVWLLRSIGGGFPQVMQCIAWVCENAERAGWPESQRLEMSAAVLQAVSLARLLSAASAGEPVAAGESLQAGRLPRQVALVGVGDRTDALSRIAQWMLEDGSDVFMLVDPYFSVRDVEFLRLIPGGSRLHVIAGLDAQRGLHNERHPAPAELEAAYSTAWGQRYDDAPPPTDVTLLGTASGRCPLHDRYVLTKRGGIQLGTSVSGLGGRESSMTTLDAATAKAIWAEAVGPWVTPPNGLLDGERVRIYTFSLG